MDVSLTYRASPAIRHHYHHAIRHRAFLSSPETIHLSWRDRRL